MAVRLGKIPPRVHSASSAGSGDPTEEWMKASESFVDGHKDCRGGGQSSNDPEGTARWKRMKFAYHKTDPNWQDRQTDRDRMFSELYEALDNYGIFSRSEGNNNGKKKRAYFPAANKQLETRVFTDHCNDVLFVGGDIIKSAVAEGKARTKSQNADFVVADGFRVPFEDGSLDAIVDVAGATWYALEPHSPGKNPRDNFKSLLYEWHRALGPKGVVVLDDYSEKGNGYISTMRWFEAMCPDIFENIKKGGFYFSVGDYRVAFKARTVKVGSVRARSLGVRAGIPRGRPLGGQAYVFEKV